VIVVIGLPLTLLVLTELATSLTRRSHPAASVVRLIRNFVVPTGALLLLVSQATVVKVDFTWTRVVATVFGFLVILVLLNGINVFVFSTARRGTWRERFPSIFVDIIRLALIIVCLAVLFAVVWGADVGGLFTALGVSSIVIGLALQQAIGPIVAGLFLLFEQPFRLGDHLDISGVRGRVVEVNWRAVHIDTGNGIRVVPNGMLAGSAFTNLSSSPGPFTVSTELEFGSDDPPQQVLALLRRVAADLPGIDSSKEPSAVPKGGLVYSVSIPVQGPAAEGPTRALLLTWLWYAARRAGLHLNGEGNEDYATPERLLGFVGSVARPLHLKQEEIEDFAERVALERFGAGEVLQRAGEVPSSTGVIVDGSALLMAPASDGEVRVGRIGVGEFIGVTAITKERVVTKVVAASDVTIVRIPVTVLNDWVRRRPALAKELGQMLDQRRKMRTDALDELDRAHTAALATDL
jgi:small-conductance mechanosensitive channel